MEKEFSPLLPRRIFLLFNVHASHGRAKKLLPQLLAEMMHRGMQVEVCKTEYRGHLTEVVRELNLNNYDALIIAGGDGSLFEMVNGYMANRSAQKIPVGIIPVGTGNAFARDLGLLKDEWMKALDIICTCQPKLTDVAQLITNAEVHYFVNILGMGFITDVQKIALSFKFMGNISYTIGVLIQIIFLKKYRMRLEMDGKVIDRKNIFIEISNTRYTSNFLMAPGASFEDGLLDVTLLNPMPRLRMLRYFPSIFKGQHITKPGIETYKARHIRVSTLKVKSLAPDGEIFGSAPFEVQCVPQALPILRP